MFKILYTAALTLLLLSFVQGEAAFSTAYGADSPFSDIILTLVNRWRGASFADPLVWTGDNVARSVLEAPVCGLLYDYWDDHGRIIFQIGAEDGHFPDIVNSTYVAVNHWWVERGKYHPKSSDYDELQPFYDSWEYTQMVWASTKSIGCMWAPFQCDVPTDQQKYNVKKTLQLVCNFYPAGNRWDQWGANVHCRDCTTEPQKTTINPSTVKIDPSVTKRSALYTPVQSDVDRIESYRNLSVEEFLPGYTPYTQDSERDNIEKNVSPKLQSRAPPPAKSDPSFQTMYIETINAWRARRGVMSKVAYSGDVLGIIAPLWEDASADKCKWPQTQDIMSSSDNSTARWAWWAVDASTSDFDQQFKYALHMWQVWGSGPTFVGSLWATFYDQLVHPDTKTFGCMWTPQCNEALAKPSYFLYCAAAGVHVPTRTTTNVLTSAPASTF